MLDVRLLIISLIVSLLMSSCSSNVDIELTEVDSIGIEDAITENDMENYDDETVIDNGKIVIVGTNGNAIIYEFVDGIPLMVSEGTEDMGVGCPYAMWVEPETNHRVVFGVMIEAKTWNIDMDKFESIPVEWREYISRIFDLEGKYQQKGY